MSPDTPATNHRRDAAAFTAFVIAAPPDRWDSAAPVPGWTARDVVDHLITWLPDLLAAGSDVVVGPGPSVQEDPVAAWRHHCDAVQALLDDPETAGRLLRNTHLGEIRVDQAVDRFYTNDVFLHSWDLAAATGQPIDLGEDRCAGMLAGMEPIEEMLRASGQYGPRVAVPDDASAQDRLIGFIGRDPAAWRAGPR